MTSCIGDLSNKKKDLYEVTCFISINNCKNYVHVKAYKFIAISRKEPLKKKNTIFEVQNFFSNAFRAGLPKHPLLNKLISLLAD